jgi:1-acyl-sn-glycerol-3-phosphate acyltransferase
MIYPKNNRLIFWVMYHYVKWLVNRHFREIVLNNIEIDNPDSYRDKSVLLISNHYSFWDALILYMVNGRSLKKKMHVMILEESMHEHIFFKYAGAFSVKKGSHDVINSLDYAANLLNDPRNLVLVYPQGKLYSNFVTQVNFEKGVSKIIKQAQGKFQLVFAAAFVQYFRHIKPTATVYLKTETEHYADKTIDRLQAAYQQFYDEKKLEQTEINAEQ